MGIRLRDIASKIEQIVFRCAKFLSVIGYIALGASCLLICVDVMLRYFWAKPIPGGYNLNEFLLVAIIASPLALCQWEKSHVRVDLLTGKVGEKTRTIMELVTLVLVLPLFAMAVWTGAAEASRALLTGDYIQGLVHYPIWPAKSLVPLGISCLCVVLIIDIVHCARACFKHKTS